MYEPLNQPSYTNISYLSTQSFPPTIPNPPHNFHSLSSDHSLSHPPPLFNSLSSVPSFSHPPTFNPYIDSGHYPSNYAGFGAPPVNYSGTNNDVTPSWVVKQAAPIKYSPVCFFFLFYLFALSWKWVVVEFLLVDCGFFFLVEFLICDWRMCNMFLNVLGGERSKVHVHRQIL